MTVSRKGRHGNRAGGKKSRPASRNRRVLYNSINKARTKEVDHRATAAKKTKEEWVIRRVTEIVGTKGGPGFVMADDVASDIIMMLLDVGGFAWDEEEIELFCRRKASYMVLKYLARKERNECEFTTSDGRAVRILEFAQSVRPMQDTIADAHYAERLLRAIPTSQREALEILCDGGNPVDVAEEMKITPWAAIALIKEGRDFVGRVDPA